MDLPDEDWPVTNSGEFESMYDLQTNPDNSTDADSDPGFLENFRDVFDFTNKSSLFDALIGTSGGRAFSLGTVVFLLLMVLSIYLDTSLRSQIFYVFDNCTQDDYGYEYIVKIRLGLSPEFTSRTDLIIEFYSNKYKLLSKFIVSGSYLENGLNIGTKLCPGMKITSLYLFKNNSLNHVEYCRAYLNTNDPSIGVHLYSIEVGDRKSVNVFFMNHAVNRSNPNATQLSLLVEEPITPKYKGIIMETSYLQASIFIYLFFLLGFFFFRLTPFEESIEIIKNLPVNRALLLNSTIIAVFTGAQYLVFREYVHARYAANNGNLQWCLAETAYECFCVAICLGLALAGVMTEFKRDGIQATYVRLVLYSACTLAYWTPIAFFYFYLFSPSNYHIGRIILKHNNTYNHSDRSRRSLKSRHPRARGQEEEDQESYIDNKVYVDTGGSKEKKERKVTRQMSPVTSPMTSPVTSPVASPVTSPVTSPVASPLTSPLTSPVTSPLQQQVVPSQPHAPKYVQQAYYMPGQDPTTTPRPFSFGLPSPVTYMNDQQQPLQAQPVAPVFQNKDPAEKSLTMNTYELVSQYQTLRDKIEKSQIKIQPRPTYEPTREEKANSLRTLKKFVAEPAAERKMSPLTSSAKSIKGKNSSKTSIASTGSDYYAAMFKDGKVKVGSISQYGSLLKQREDH